MLATGLPPAGAEQLALPSAPTVQPGPALSGAPGSVTISDASVRPAATVSALPSPGCRHNPQELPLHRHGRRVGCGRKRQQQRNGR